MSPQEFRDKIDGYIALVLDNQLSKDDAADASLDCLTAVDEAEYWDCYYYYEKQFVAAFCD